MLGEAVTQSRDTALISASTHFILERPGGSRPRADPRRPGSEWDPVPVERGLWDKNTPIRVQTPTVRWKYDTGHMCPPRIFSSHIKRDKEQVKSTLMRYFI